MATILVRLGLYIVLLFNVYYETGVYTTVTLALLCLSAELTTTLRGLDKGENNDN